MDVDRAALVDAYWKQRELHRGSRSERLEADQYVWAWEAVDEAARDGDDDVLDLIDDLLHADNADPGYVAAGPIEDLLSYHAERFANAVAERCRRDVAWSTALPSVLYSGDPAAVEPLRPWLHPAVFQDRQASVNKRPAAQPTKNRSSRRGRGSRDR